LSEEGQVIGVPKFVMELMDGAHWTITRAVDGLSDEQLRFRPSDETNSILWLVWHLYRAQDFMAASLSGEEQVWTSGGWADRFGMPLDDSGFGHTSQQLDDFQPGGELVMSYAEKVREAFANRLRSLPSGTLDGRANETADDDGGGDVQTNVVRICMDTMQHAGQIAYLRGLQTGMGWFF
jgi:hypothetical protein